MKKNNFIIIIPARYNSKRLPGKPLIKIKGLSMILRTCIQCSKSVKKNKILVATDDMRIKKECEKEGFRSMITSKNCFTGTDRVYEIAKKTNYDHYINVQGDEPVFNPKDLRKLLKSKNKFKKDVLLGFTKITNKKDIYNKAIPKIVFDRYYNLIYASRSQIPFFHSTNKMTKFNYYRQVLAYCFPRKKLLKFGKIKKKSPLENSEDIEILRFLELGIKVKLIKMSQKSTSVDLPEDINKINKLLSQ